MVGKRAVSAGLEGTAETPGPEAGLEASSVQQEAQISKGPGNDRIMYVLKCTSLGGVLLAAE